jgi:hypothetical protein
MTASSRNEGELMQQYGIVSPSIIEDLAKIFGSEYRIGNTAIPGNDF